MPIPRNESFVPSLAQLRSPKVGNSRIGLEVKTPLQFSNCVFYSALGIKGLMTWDSIPSLITKALVAVVLASFRFQQYPTDCKNYNAHSDCLLMFGESTSG